MASPMATFSSFWLRTMMSIETQGEFAVVCFDFTTPAGRSSETTLCANAGSQFAGVDLASCTAGGVHDPSVMEACGQYVLTYSEKSASFGAGSQLPR